MDREKSGTQVRLSDVVGPITQHWSDLSSLFAGISLLALHIILQIGALLLEEDWGSPLLS